MAVCMQVSWSGIPNPTIGDVIAYYVQTPATTVDTLAPLKFQWVNRTPGYQSGSGSIVYASTWKTLSQLENPFPAGCDM